MKMRPDVLVGGVARFARVARVSRVTEVAMLLVCGVLDAGIEGGFVVVCAPLLLREAGSGSSGVPIRAMGAPMGAELPSETSILRSVPLAKASISMLTLSVSTSAKGSPFLTVSPSCLIQWRILPSSIVSPILGISTFFIIYVLRVPFQDGEIGVRQVPRRGGAVWCGVGALVAIPVSQTGFPLLPIYCLAVAAIPHQAGGHKGPYHPSTPPPPLRDFPRFHFIVNIMP